ncbi:MAG: hypothetical protein Q4G27_02825 [Flavobacteriaceae bacterium]|nr:hypothetical protein [Flavobacteriaceae bacterium]
MNKFVVTILLGFLFQACELINPPKILITKDYIINEFWNDKNNSILIQKLDLVDTANISKSDIDIIKRNFGFLKVDSTLIAGYEGLNTNNNIKLMHEKVYFNKDNGWQWFVLKDSIYIEKKLIGELENNTWYKFSNLNGHGGFFIYVYVDLNGQVYKFNQDFAGPF